MFSSLDDFNVRKPYFQLENEASSYDQGNFKNKHYHDNTNAITCQGACDGRKLSYSGIDDDKNSRDLREKYLRKKTTGTIDVGIVCKDCWKKK